MADTAKLRRPDWGHRTSLFQARQPAFWLYVLVLVVSLFIVMGSLIRGAAQGGLGLSFLILLVYAVPVILIVRILDLYEREPISLVIGALLWGGIAAIGISLRANTSWGRAIGQYYGPEFASKWSAALTAPIIEEVSKALAVVVIYLIARDEIDDIMDGFVYGAMAGLGFSFVEDMLYFVRTSQGDLGVLFKMYFVRVLASGIYGHVLFTGLTGIGIAYFVTRAGVASRIKRFVVAIGLFLVAMAAHAFWNSPVLRGFFDNNLSSLGHYISVAIGSAIKGLPFFLFLVLMVVLARRREGRWLDAALQTEVGKDGITEEELHQLDLPGARRKARKEAKRRLGPQAASILRQLQKQQINLAMVATRVEEGNPDLAKQREHCRALREQLKALAKPAAAT
jgi:RsiW-degrading membrane proteinase PrsW (M82 family)